MKFRRFFALVSLYHLQFISHHLKCFTLNVDHYGKIHDKTFPVVAYIVTFTDVRSSALIDAAAVLKRSIELNSLPLNTNARYRADYFALLSSDLMPGAVTFVEKLVKIGYEVEIKPLPVDPDDIHDLKDSNLKQEIRQNGCCGHKELMKLYSLTFTNHAVAVHLDLDTLLLQPLDDLFDVIQYPPLHPKGVNARETIAESIAPTHSPDISVTNATVNAFFTKDYNMVPRGKESRIGVSVISVRTKSLLNYSYGFSH